MIYEANDHPRHAVGNRLVQSNPERPLAECLESGANLRPSFILPLQYPRNRENTSRRSLRRHNFMRIRFFFSFRRNRDLEKIPVHERLSEEETIPGNEKEILFLNGENFISRGRLCHPPRTIDSLEQIFAIPVHGPYFRIGHDV